MQLQRNQSADGVCFYTSPLLHSLRLPHAFSTRIGGISRGPFESLNLGNPNGCPIQDDRSNIAENYRLLMRAIGCQDRDRLYLHQVHGPGVEVVTGAPFSCDTKGDALVTTEPGKMLSVRVADCCPVLLASTDKPGVAAIHAGWRGAVGGVIQAAVGRLMELTGCRPSEMVAAVGPCIGPDAFEVGPEVLEEFDRQFGPQSPVTREPSDKGHVNLPEACRLQLLAMGLPADQIDTTDRCTYRDSHEFFSHRREKGVTGRMAALIGV